ncbi:DUF4087 domain-containing protein [Roseibium aestuarii]|uniref:DUF4087 domain-containing protein n=1 Tax=Roseibium aestuarii TaxID=2600299 RepID=A0ABW4JX74_9HYPH|nr:DUF4087 domain-containing protein [Roseibium aestuarii]
MKLTGSTAWTLAVTVLAGVFWAVAPALAAETRCGWIANPTPGNWWLTDRQATWILRTQGRDYEPLGMDRIGDISAGEYVASNGSYGYACACAHVDTTVFDGEPYITAIHSFDLIPLARCEKDPALPR